MNMKPATKTMLIGCCAVFFLLMAPGLSRAADTFVKIATGNLGGTYYPVGVAMGQLIQKKNPQIISSAMVTAGSVENISLLQTGEAQVAIMQTNIVDDAVNGAAPFKQKYSNLRVITALWPHAQHFVVTKDIKTLDDLKGKRFVVGAARGGTEVITYLMMDAAGISYRNKDKDKNDFTPVWLAYNEMVETLSNQQASGGHFQAYPPGSAIAELLTSGNFHVLPMTKEYIATLKSKYSFFVPFTLKANTYPNQPEDVLITAFPNLLVTLDSVPEDVIYAVTKTIFENLPDLHAAHQATQFITTATALDGVTIPPHKGTERYLREVGALK